MSLRRRCQSLDCLGGVPVENQGNHCRGCIHYYVTWDNRFPAGCRAYGIKSKNLPALEVLRVTGQGCVCFAGKKRTMKTKSGSLPRRGTSRDRFF